MQQVIWVDNNLLSEQSQRHACLSHYLPTLHGSRQVKRDETPHEGAHHAGVIAIDAVSEVKHVRLCHHFGVGYLALGRLAFPYAVRIVAHAVSLDGHNEERLGVEARTGGEMHVVEYRRLVKADVVFLNELSSHNVTPRFGEGMTQEPLATLGFLRHHPVHPCSAPRWLSCSCFHRRRRKVYDVFRVVTVKDIVDDGHEIVIAVSKQKVFSLGLLQPLIAGPSCSAGLSILYHDNLQVLTLRNGAQETLQEMRRSAMWYDERIGQDELTN